MTRLVCAVLIVCVVVGCSATPPAAGPFADDVAFLRQHTDVIVLWDPATGAQVVASPSMQGRVLTSTAGAPDWTSHGWINRELIASRQLQPHINAFGGEDRFWLGPEGGQFSIFFPAGAPFDLEHWQTPAPIDSEPWTVASRRQDRVAFSKRFQLVNYAGTRFDVQVDRIVRLMHPAAVWQALGIPPVAGVRMVACESSNTLTNAGEHPWTPEAGLLSIWILGMFNPSPQTTVVIPIVGGDEGQLGPAVNSDYFGAVPPERLTVRNNVVYFRGDGLYRSKIGIGPRRAKPVMGSYDAANNVLTLVHFTLPPGRSDYVNSMWKIHDDPYNGDVVNSYNDGPASPGAKPIGPFYELESSSPAAVLAPGASIEHLHRTIHFQGEQQALDTIARSVLGVGLADIANALPR